MIRKKNIFRIVINIWSEDKRNRSLMQHAALILLSCNFRVSANSFIQIFCLAGVSANSFIQFFTLPEFRKVVLLSFLLCRSFGKWFYSIFCFAGVSESSFTQFFALPECRQVVLVSFLS